MPGTLVIPDLVHGPLLGRRKRFFADVKLNGDDVVAHCANTGSMRSLLLPNTEAFLSKSANPNRKLAYTLEALHLPTGAWAMVNTQRPNEQVALALANGVLAGFPLGSKVEREVRCSEESRLDARVTLPTGKRVWIEVKNVTLMEEITPGIASFPDAVSTRATKHLHELASLVAQGERACIVYLLNRNDVQHFVPAKHIDPVYAKTLAEVVQVGVEVLPLRTNFHWDNSNLSLSISEDVTWSLA